MFFLSIPHILFSIFLFVLGNVVAEGANADTMNPLQNPMSAYLSGNKYCTFQSLTYLIFATSLWFLGDIWGTTALKVACIALWMVVITHWVNIKLNNITVTHLHLASAGIAFGGCTIAIWQYTHNWYAGLPLIMTAIMCLFWKLFDEFFQKELGVKAVLDDICEKLYSAGLIIGFFLAITNS